MLEDDSHQKIEQKRTAAATHESGLAATAAGVWGDQPNAGAEKHTLVNSDEVTGSSEKAKPSDFQQRLDDLDRVMHEANGPLADHPNLKVIGRGQKDTVILAEHGNDGEIARKFMVDIATGVVIAQSKPGSSSNWEREPVNSDGSSRSSLLDLIKPVIEENQNEARDKAENPKETSERVAKADIEQLWVMPGVSENFSQEMSQVIAERIPGGILSMISRNVQGFKIVLESIDSPSLLSQLPEEEHKRFQRVLDQEKISNGLTVTTDNRLASELGGKFMSPYVVMLQETQREREKGVREYDRPLTLLHELGHAVDQALAKQLGLAERSFSDSPALQEAWKKDLEQQKNSRTEGTWSDTDERYYIMTKHFRKNPSEAVAEAVFSTLDDAHATLTERNKRAKDTPGVTGLASSEWERVEAYRKLFPNTYKLVQTALQPYL